MLATFFVASPSFGADAVYLKALGSGETRETQDGTSWATAFATVDAAVTAATNRGVAVYAAGGIYPFTKSITLTKALTVYGGFPGASDAETVDDRDTTKYETVFTGDTALDDTWYHCVTNSSYGITRTECTGKLLISDGKFNRPPAYTEGLDTYCPCHRNTNLSCAFYVNGGGLTVEGVTFSGFYSGDNYGSVIRIGSNTGFSLNDCHFIGNTFGQGALYFDGNAGAKTYTISNSEILHCWGSNRGSGVTIHPSSTTVKLTGCRFESIARTSNTSSQMFSTWGGGTFYIFNCAILRCNLCTGSSFNSSYGGPANIFGGENSGYAEFRDCVISNCCAATSNAYGLPMMSGNPYYQLTRCFITNNLCLCSPASGSVYCMFGNAKAGGTRRTYEGTTFAGNEVRAQAVAATSGSYALGIVGCNLNGPDAHLVNCTFSANRAVAPEKEGVTRIRSRGVAMNATVSDSTAQAALANCTFTGPKVAGVYEIVQFGSGHSRNLNIVNCVFDADGADAPDPVYADVPSKIRFIQSAILNCWTPNETMSYEGLEYDKIPLVRTVADATTGRFVCVPQAKTPGLRETCDVATNGTSRSWVFRRPGSSTWEALGSNVAVSGSGFDAKLVWDARCEARTAGAFTRGTVQPLSDAAESGKSVVVRIDPPAGGSVTAGPVSQAVASGASMQSVTVASVDDKVYQFVGWYDAEGTKIGSATTLSGLSLVSDISVVTAKFVAADVDLTYDLGPSGKFANGLSTITVSVQPGSVLVVPPYTVNEGWVVLGFDVPVNVPKTNATYKADYVTTSVRTIYVTPEGAGKKDGSSWANAYDNLATAYADAARYRGEVWVKKGVYRLSTHIPMKSNVSVLGGFDGDETSASEADPTNNLTIVSGDVNDDDYWRPNGNSGALATHKIWQDGVYNPPNPTRANAYWAASGNVSDNASTAFACDGVATNNVFDGLVVSGFKNGAFLLNAGNFKGSAFRRCRFLGNNASAGNDSESRGMIRLVSSCLVENCVFDGNNYPISMVANSGGQKLTVRRCVFQNGYCSNSGSGGIRIDANNVALDLSDSRFYRNYCCVRHSQPGSSLVLRENCSGTVTDCSFEEDLNNGDSHGSVIAYNAVTVSFTRCRFERNAYRESQKNQSENRNGACVSFICYVSASFRDCLFADNLLALQYGVGEYYFSCALANESGSTTFINTTFLRNRVTHKDANALGAVMAVGCNTAFVNCTLKDSCITGESEKCSEIRVPGTPTVGIVNTVLASTNETYKAIVASTNWTPTVANSYVQGFDRTAYEPLAANGYLYDVVTEGDVGFSSRPQTNELGAVAWGMRGLGPVRGRPVWLKSGVVYFHDTAANSAKPWRKVVDRTSYAASVSGLTTSSPRIPDAFGSPRRRLRDCTVGPLESKPGLILFVR